MPSRAAQLFLILSILSFAQAHRDGTAAAEAEGIAVNVEKTSLAVHESGSIRLTSKVAVNATTEEQAMIAAAIQTETESAQASLAQAVGRFSQAMEEQYSLHLDKKRKALANPSKVQVHYPKADEAVELDQLKEENEALRKQAATQKVEDLQDEIAKMDLWDEASAKPDFKVCQILKGTDAMTTVSNLAECTKQLQNAAKETMQSKDKSQAANTKYIEKFQEVMTVLEQLKDMQALWTAFQLDHKAAKNTLTKQADGLKKWIDDLAGAKANTGGSS